MKYRPRLLAAAVLVVALGLSFLGLRPSHAVTQPIAFPHAPHVKDVGLECDACHPGVKTSFHAQLPDLSVCMECHEDKLSDNPEEQKVRDLAKLSPPPQFRKLFLFPNHVFYSHRRHVVVAKIPCETCHGAIAETSAPPKRPLVRITMQFCLDCHRRRGVTVDCIACHR